MELCIVSILAAVIISGCAPSVELGYWDKGKFGGWNCVENNEPYKNKKCEETKK